MKFFRRSVPPRPQSVRILDGATGVGGGALINLRRLVVTICAAVGAFPAVAQTLDAMPPEAKTEIQAACQEKPQYCDVVKAMVLDDFTVWKTHGNAGIDWNKHDFSQIKMLNAKLDDPKIFAKVRGFLATRFPPPPDLSLPQYDVNARCATRGTGGYVTACWKSEQDSYDALKVIWDRIPDPGRIWCLRAMKPYRSMDYTVILECTENWMAAHHLDDAAPFHP